MNTMNTKLLMINSLKRVEQSFKPTCYYVFALCDDFINPTIFKIFICYGNIKEAGMNTIRLTDCSVANIDLNDLDSYDGDVMEDSYDIVFKYDHIPALPSYIQQNEVIQFTIHKEK